jgi:hypothetical protein
MKWLVPLLFLLIILPCQSAWKAGWLYRTPLTVLHSGVNGDAANFPVFVDLDDLPDTFFDHCNANGTDLRVTASDGTTELAREVVWLSRTANDGELYFKAPNLYNATNASFYLYYGNGDAADYATSDTYGRNNVWTADFEVVAHFQEDPDSASFVNSTGGPGGTYTNTTGLATGAGKIGNSLDASGTSPVGHVVMSDITEADLNYSFSTFVKFNSTSCCQAFFEYSSTGGTVGGRRVGALYNATKINWNHNNFDGYVEPSTVLSTGTWYHFTVNSFDQGLGTLSTTNAWVNGADKAQKTNYTSIATNGTLTKIASSRTATEPLDGFLDEMRYYKAHKADSWMLTESAGLRSPSTFYTLAAEEEQPVSPNVMMYGTDF